MEGLTVGHIVHYVLESRKKGEIRPAIVVRDWSNADLPGSDGMVNLQVFTDGFNDGFLESVGTIADNGKSVPVTASHTATTIWRTSVHYSEAKEPGTWHWPDRSSDEMQAVTATDALPALPAGIKRRG